MFVLHRIIVQCASSASSGLFVLHRMIALFRRTRRSTSCSVQVRLVQRLVQLFRGTRRSAIRRTAHCDALCGVSKGSVPASVLPAKRRGPPRAPRPAARNDALFGRVGTAETFRPPPPPVPAVRGPRRRRRRDRLLGKRSTAWGSDASCGGRSTECVRCPLRRTHISCIDL